MEESKQSPEAQSPQPFDVIIGKLNQLLAAAACNLAWLILIGCFTSLTAKLERLVQWSTGVSRDVAGEAAALKANIAGLNQSLGQALLTPGVIDAAFEARINDLLEELEKEGVDVALTEWKAGKPEDAIQSLAEVNTAILGLQADVVTAARNYVNAQAK